MLLTTDHPEYFLDYWINGKDSAEGKDGRMHGALCTRSVSLALKLAANMHSAMFFMLVCLIKLTFPENLEFFCMFPSIDHVYLLMRFNTTKNFYQSILF